MSDRAAKGGETELEKGEEHLPGARRGFSRRDRFDGHDAHAMYWPPFTESVEPVMKPPLSPAR